MSGINDVLAAIDGALEDWSVSPDAMRWTPEPESPATRFERPPAARTVFDWRIVEDPSVAAGEVVLAVDVSRDEETLLAYRRALTTTQREVLVAPRTSGVERERLLQLVAQAYDVPVCLAAGHAWGPEEVRVGVDAGPEGASVISAYRAECTRCGQERIELRPGWAQELRR